MKKTIHQIALVLKFNNTKISRNKYKGIQCVDFLRKGITASNTGLVHSLFIFSNNALSQRNSVCQNDPEIKYIAQKYRLLLVSPPAIYSKTEGGLVEKVF